MKLWAVDSIWYLNSIKGDCMDKKQFKEFCKNEFETHGFIKKKNMFYLFGHDLLCGIDLQKSNYSNVYYINYYFFIGNYKNTNKYPIYCESDIQGRIVVMSKKQTYQGKTFATAQIEYEEYTEQELKILIDAEFEKKILPPINIGKKFIYDNLNRLYFLNLNQEEVKKKLI